MHNNDQKLRQARVSTATYSGIISGLPLPASVYSCQKSSWEKRMSSSPIVDLQGLQQSQENRGNKLAFSQVLTFVWFSPVVKMLFG